MDRLPLHALPSFRKVARLQNLRAAAEALHLTPSAVSQQVRWLLPRMGRWRQHHPEWPLELHSTQQVVDLQREGYDAALRTGSGRWPGLRAERLLHSPLIAVAAPARAARLRAAGLDALAAEPLLGSTEDWRRFLAEGDAELRAKPVADFNDAGLMLDAVEQDLGIALVRALLAADALQAGRLARLSPLSLDEGSGSGYAYWLAFPEARAGWPPLQAFRDWLMDEADAARRTLATMGVPAGRD